MNYLQILEKTINMIVASPDYQKWLKTRRKDRDIPGYYFLAHRIGITAAQRERSNIYYKERQRKRRLEMKKVLAALLLMISPCILKADILGDQIKASLVDHVSASSQWTTKGENRLALLTDIVEIGQWKGSAIGQLRFGFTGITNPDDNQTAGAGYVADAYINISPLIREFVTLSPNWTFLNSVEAGPAFAYDFREKHSYLAFSVGLAFGLNPKP